MIKWEYFSKIKEEISWAALLEKFGLRMRIRKRAGKNTLGTISCPFHKEKHPSCAFFKDGKFHCFGCGADGDMIDFVRQKLKLDYPGTIMFFHRKFNIPLPAGTTPATLKKPGNWPCPAHSYQ
jgi:DNA primase